MKVASQFFKARTTNKYCRPAYFIKHPSKITLFYAPLLEPCRTLQLAIK